MKSKLALFFLLVILSPLTSLGQNISAIDSLKAVSSNQSLIKKITTYNQIAWEYRKSYPDSTIYYAQKAIDFTSSSPELREFVPKSLNFKGVGHFYEGDNIKAFELYQQAKDSAIIYGDSLQYGYSLNNIGRLYFNQGDYMPAYDNFFSALEIFKLLNDKISMSYAYKSLAELYQTQDNLEKALEMSVKTAELRQSFDDPSGIISIYLEIAGIHAQMENYSDALTYFTDAYDIAAKINDEANLAIINLSIAKMNTKRGQLNSALATGQKALEFASNAKNINLIIQVYSLLGDIYYLKNDWVSAELYFKKVNSLATNNDIAFDQNAYFYLSKIYENRGDVPLAFKSFQSYSELKEKTENVNTARAIERLESRLALQAKQIENELLKEHQKADQEVIKNQKSFNLAASVIAGLSLILLIIIWFSASRWKKINKDLQLKNDKIEGQQKKISLQNKEIRLQNDTLLLTNKQLDDLNNEKDSLLNLVAHDMKAPFHRIKGLAELLRLTTINEEQTQYVDMIKSNSKHGAYLINDLLDVNSIMDDKEDLRIDAFDLKNFLEQISADFIIELTNKQINFKIECEPGVNIQSEKSSLSRILENLMSNAIKFSGLSSQIILSGGTNTKGFWIKVKDFGPGFTEEDKTNLFKKFKKLSAKPTAGESSNGLGLAIVKALTDKLGGRIELATEKGKYSEFTLYFPFVSSELKS